MNKLLKSIASALLPKDVQLDIRVRKAMRGASDLELALLPALAGQGAFVDIGANMGSWTGPATRAYKHVHAFEPDADLARALQRCGPKNLTVHTLALSNHEGVGRFAVPVIDGKTATTRGSLEANANPGFADVVHEVRLATLDSLHLLGIDAMKIDVEGHEEAVLEGAAGTIARERPAMIIEIEERHHAGRSEDIVQSIAVRDYGVYFVRAGRLERFHRGMFAELQRQDQQPLQGVKLGSYINNFVFLPVEKVDVLASLQRLVERK